MDHKYISYAGLKRFFYTKILKLINLKIDKVNGDISNTKVRSVDTISTEFPDPVAGESTKAFLGKVKKCLADWKAIKSTLLTLSMLTNQHENSTSKIPTSALVYALKQSLDTTNSNLTGIQNSFTEIKTVTIYQTRCDSLNGGYVKFGRLVIVSLQIRVLSPGTNFAMLTGFPVPLLGSGNVPVEMNGIKTLSNEATGVFINSVGSLCVRAAVANDYISVSGSYLST